MVQRLTHDAAAMLDKATCTAAANLALGEDLLLELLNEGVVEREDSVLKGKVGASVGLGARDLNTTWI